MLITLIGCSHIRSRRTQTPRLQPSYPPLPASSSLLGNIKHVQVIASTLQSIVVGHEVLVSALASQVISNVPAAIMLSGFSSNGIGLLCRHQYRRPGNTGRLSRGSLITLRVYGRSRDAQTGATCSGSPPSTSPSLSLFLGLASFSACRPVTMQRDAGNADVLALCGARAGDRLEAIVEGTGDNLVLLSLGQVVEVHSVTGNANGELGVLLRVSLGVEQRITVEHVDVQSGGHPSRREASIMLTRLSARRACGMSATFIGALLIFGALSRRNRKLLLEIISKH